MGTTETNVGQQLTLQLQGKGGPYGNNYETVVVDVSMETQQRLHVRVRVLTTGELSNLKKTSPLKISSGCPFYCELETLLQALLHTVVMRLVGQSTHLKSSQQLTALVLFSLITSEIFELTHRYRPQFVVEVMTDM